MWTGCQGQSQTLAETHAAGSPLIRGILSPLCLRTEHGGEKLNASDFLDFSRSTGLLFSASVFSDVSLHLGIYMKQAACGLNMLY